MARRRKEDAEATRIAILDAAERVFYERGVARTRLEDVAAAAGVTRGAIYWHFENKAALFEEVHERVLLPIRAAVFRVVGEDSKAGLAELERVCVEVLNRIALDEQSRRVMTIVLLRCEYTDEMTSLANRTDEARDTSCAALTAFFARLRATGEIAVRHDPGAMADALHAYMQGLLAEYLKAPDRADMASFAPAAIAPFFAGLRA